MPKFSDEESVDNYIRNSVGFHPGTTETAPLFEIVREAIQLVTNTLAAVCPVQSQYFEKAVDAIDVACMQAIKSIAVQNPLGHEQMRKP